MTRILITGANSYIGDSVKNWLEKPSTKVYHIDTLVMENRNWKQKDFSPYDVVFHVAGIAHVPRRKENKGLYLKVNRDLAIEVATKAKDAGVKQFIFMSSIIVYGKIQEDHGMISHNTLPQPTDYYGESKLEAENGLLQLQSNNFKIVIVRSPMIYGQDSKGNYPRLAKLAKITPIFPNYPNQRSMLHIDNLSKFIQEVIDKQSEGIFYPQNKEYVTTSLLVQTIGQMHNKNIMMTRLFNPLIKIFSRKGLIQKVFGNLYYERSMSQYSELDYQIRDFKESICLTEKERNA